MQDRHLVAEFVRNYYQATLCFEKKKYLTAASLYGNSKEIYENNPGLKDALEKIHYRVSSDSVAMMNLSQCYAVINKNFAYCLSISSYATAKSHQEKVNTLQKMIHAYSCEWNEYVDSGENKELQICRLNMVDAFYKLAEQYYAMASYFKAFDMLKCLKKIKECYDSIYIGPYIEKFGEKYQQSGVNEFANEQKQLLESDLEQLKTAANFNKKKTVRFSLFKDSTQDKINKNKRKRTDDGQTTVKKPRSILRNSSELFPSQDEACESSSLSLSEEQRVFQAFKKCLQDFCKENQTNFATLSEIIRIMARYYRTSNKEHADGKYLIINKNGEIHRTSESLYHVAYKLGNAQSLKEIEFLYRYNDQDKNKKRITYQHEGIYKDKRMREQIQRMNQSEKVQLVRDTFENYFDELETLYGEHFQTHLPSILYEIGFYLKDASAKEFFMSKAGELGSEAAQNWLSNQSLINSLTY